MNGILFTIENQKATREKRKNQTRRLDGLKDINKFPNEWVFKEVLPNGLYWFQHPQLDRYDYENYKNDEGRDSVEHYSLYNTYVKPRYNIGETIYLKEAYYFYRRIGTQANIKYIRDGFVTWVSIPKDKPTPKEGYHSPLFLPEWAARDFVKIKGIGIDRLQNITREDIRKEGVILPVSPRFTPNDKFSELHQEFADLWDSINGKRVRSKEYTSTYGWARGGIERKHYTYLPSPYCWDANPWTWAYSYELLEDKPIC